jgi:hypothetical protein
LSQDVGDDGHGSLGPADGLEVAIARLGLALVLREVTLKLGTIIVDEVFLFAAVM